MPDFRALIAQFPDASDEDLLALARGGGGGSATSGLPTGLRDAWDWGNAPLVDLADDAFGDSTAGRFGVSLAESMTSPLSLAGLALTGGASVAGKAGLLGLSRAARGTEAALNLPYIAEGLHTLAGAEDWGTAAGGGLEAALGAWGLRGALGRPTTGGGSLAADMRGARLLHDERGSLPLGQGEPDLPYEEMVAETLDGGGASRFLDGRRPSSGAMVGGVVPPQTLETLTPEALARFAREHRAALEAAPNRTLGSFADKGAFDLDVSENVGGLEEALRLARQRGEKSVFDLETFETYPNPAHPDTATHWQELQHRSKVRGLTAVDPEFQGRGQAGDERARRGAWPRDYVARTFWNTPESLVEGNIAKLPQQYTGFVPKATLLDQADPLYRELEEEALRRAAAEGDTSQARVQTLLERLIKDHPNGFAGMKLTETMDPAFTQPVDPEWLLEQTILPQSPMAREPYVSLNRSARFMRQPTSAMAPMIRQEVQTFGRRPLLPASVIEELRGAGATDAAALPRAVGDSGPRGLDLQPGQSATGAAESAGAGLASPAMVAPLGLAGAAGAAEDGEEGLSPIQLALLAGAGIGVGGMALSRVDRLRAAAREGKGLFLSGELQGATKEELRELINSTPWFHGTDRKIARFRSPSYFSQSPAEASAYALGTPKGEALKRARALGRKYRLVDIDRNEVPALNADEVASILEDYEGPNGQWFFDDGGTIARRTGATPTGYGRYDIARNLKAPFDYRAGAYTLAEGPSDQAQEIIDALALPDRTPGAPQVYRMQAQVENPYLMPSALEGNRFAARLGMTPELLEELRSIQRAGHDSILTPTDADVFSWDPTGMANLVSLVPSRMRPAIGLKAASQAGADEAARASAKAAPALLAAPAAMDEDGELDPIQMALATAGLGVAGMGLLRRGRTSPALNAPYERVGDRLLISTRVPTGVAARGLTPEPSAALFTGLDVAQADPALMAKLARGIDADPLLRGGQSDAVRAFTEAASRSIGRLIDMVPEDYRLRSSGWYEGAHRLGNDLGARIGVSGEQGAGLLASQSPSKDWNQNIEIANRLGRWWREFANTDAPFTQAHADQFAATTTKAALAEVKNNKLTGEAASRVLANAEQKIADARGFVGTRFGDLPDFQRAQMIRAHSELVEPQHYSLYTPEGEAFSTATTGAGAPALLQWQSYPIMVNGLSVLEDGSPANISAAMGMGHKVRSFFNNINVPADPRSVTVDTHNVAGAHFRPLGGSTPEVAAVMGGTPASAGLGIRGKHAIYRDAVAMAAAQRGLRPSQAQSISWEGIKGLFTPAQKRDARFKAALGGLFADYQRGMLSEAQLYDRIEALAGGFKPADWAQHPPAAY